MSFAKDQYFLNEKYLEMEIKAASLRADDIVLEVGAGSGNLTQLIARHCKVVAIEIDEHLADMIPENENIEIRIGNAVGIIKDIQFTKVISNVPYSATQDILIEILKKSFDTAVVVVQREFANKLFNPKEKLQRVIEDCCDAEILCSVPADAFKPKAVDSAMVMLKQKKKLDEKFWKFLCRIFRNRNRNASNVLGIRSGKKVHQLSLGELKDAFKNA